MFGPTAIITSTAWAAMSFCRMSCSEERASEAGYTRSYALEALARRTQRDTRCKEGQRLDDAAAAAAWKS